MIAIKKTRAHHITFQSPFVLMEAHRHIREIWDELMRVGHPFGPQWGIDAFPKTFELKDVSVAPTDDSEGLRSRAYFFWTGGNACRIEVAGHTSHYGTHWDNLNAVSLWWYPIESDQIYPHRRVRWNLSPQVIQVLAMSAYFRARTGEGCDYPDGNPHLAEWEGKTKTAVKAELGILQSRYRG